MAMPDTTMKIFAGLLESPQNSLVEQAAANGRIPIGYSCSFVPEALLMAGKLFPVRLHAPGLTGTERKTLSGFGPPMMLTGKL